MSRRFPGLLRLSPFFPVLPLAIACSSAETPAPPAPEPSREVTYRQNGTPLRGFVAYPSDTTKRPGVLVFHEWWGHNAHTRNAAQKLADAGYVGLAVDMYGDGKATTHPDTANAFMMEVVSNLATLQARFDAALAQLKADPRVDSTRIAAIGYCFGGAIVLSMARAGAPDLDAVASFHGAMPPGVSMAPAAVRAKVLILHGNADPMVPNDSVSAFVKAMQDAGADVRLVTYALVKHSFTNPRADSVGMDGLGYDAQADAGSWQSLLDLLREVFP
jgi:dienelactone hydrolase